MNFRQLVETAFSPFTSRAIRETTAPDDHPRRATSLGQERRRNPRLDAQGKPPVNKLPYPEFTQQPGAGDRMRSIWPDDLPEQMRSYRERMSQL